MYKDFYFPSRVTLTSGVTYYIVFKVSSPTDSGYNIWASPGFRDGSINPGVVENTVFSADHANYLKLWYVTALEPGATQFNSFNLATTTDALLLTGTYQIASTTPDILVSFIAGYNNTEQYWSQSFWATSTGYHSFDYEIPINYALSTSTANQIYTVTGYLQKPYGDPLTGGYQLMDSEVATTSFVARTQA